MPTVRHAPLIYHYENKDWRYSKQEYEGLLENTKNKKLFEDINNGKVIGGEEIFENDFRIENSIENDFADEADKHSNEINANIVVVEDYIEDFKTGYEDTFLLNKFSVDESNGYYSNISKINTKDNLRLLPDDRKTLIQNNNKLIHPNNTLLSKLATEVNNDEISEETETSNHRIDKNNEGKHRIRRNERDRSKWRVHSRMLATLVILNLTGRSLAVEVIASSTLASLLGYPSSCTLGAEVRPCTLALTCWLGGGTRVHGCGGWLFSCCQPSWESVDNDVPSSEWSYKVTPPRLRQVPQRSVMPNNVFRRRVDDDVTQYECGVPASRLLQKRIIGGREARFAEFPWQAHVRISEFQCGGVLVSRWYVATAAHCVSRAHIRDISVWLGALDTSAGAHTARKVGVVQKILHPLFQFRMTQPDRYDVALLRLSRGIAFTRHIRAICLPDAGIQLWGRVAVIAGWGKTDATDTHTGTNMLRSATVPILSKEQCIAWHQSKHILVEIHSEMLCAGHSDGHQDACLGDSGGPLIVLDNGRYYLVGITSAGFGCGVDHQPGIYHNVQVTANWIRALISTNMNFNDI